MQQSTSTSESSDMPVGLRVGLAAFITLFPIICVCNGLGEPKYWGPERLRWVIWCVVGLWALGAAWGWWYALRGVFSTRGREHAE